MTAAIHSGRTLVQAISMAAALIQGTCVLAADGPPSVGPQTENRFPPLTVPPGFKVTLFACDPLVEYPSVIAIGPRPATLFVAYDYMTGLGVEIVRRDEIRLVEDADGDGHADRTTVIADGFNSIQGLAWHANTLYVMHAPLLTSLHDADGDGKYEVRRDLLSGLGLPPEKNSSRLHCANGVVVGHDGWLYLAMGDNGTDVTRPEGDRLLFQAGGILRCRPDGRDLHVFSSGLRNIYDIALDEELNVFVRDNENDGGTYMIRVCRSFHGADHGYPYHYYERPDEALAPLADLGRGSSAGIVCYLETAFPPEYRGNLFCCEWGRSVVRYERQRAASHFAPMKEFEFAAAAETDPYGLKPTDVIVDRDGSLLVSDWGDGQRPKRGRGRIYRIAPAAAPTANNPPAKRAADGLAGWIDRLDEPGAFARIEAQDAIARKGEAGVAAVREALAERRLGPSGRLHAVWILARRSGPTSVPDLLAMAEGDPDPRVRAQAVRAIADVTDPILDHHRLDTGRGDEEVAARLASLAKNADPRVTLEIVVALGRLKWSEAPAWLRDRLKSPDPALAHAAMQALRRADNWPAVLALLDLPDEQPIRGIALRAVAGRAETAIVDGLIDRLQKELDPRRRGGYADALTRIHKLPGPWIYWGYRPGARPANTEAWDRTEIIAKLLDRVLNDPHRDVRAALLRRMQREQIPVSLATLSAWLQTERAADRVSAILEALAKLPASDTRALLAAVIGERDYAADNRRAALSLFIAGIDDTSEPQLLELAGRVEDGPVLVELLADLGRHTRLDAGPLTLSKLDSRAADVRAAALGLAAVRQFSEASLRVKELLGDPDVGVRRAAAIAAGRLAVKEAADALTTLTRDPDPELRGASLGALRLLGVRGAVDAAVAALSHPASQLAALEYLTDFGGPAQAGPVTAVAASSRSVEVLTAVVRALAAWESRDSVAVEQRRGLEAGIADVHGASGVLLRWHAVGPLTPSAVAELVERAARLDVHLPDSQSLIAGGPESKIEIKRAGDDPSRAAWLATADVSLGEPARAQFLASSGGTLQVWLNGRSAYHREKVGAFQPDSDRFEADLVKGANRVVVRTDAANGAAQFHLRFRRLSSSAGHERLAQFALQNAGSADRGREIFLNAEKSLCMKCHRLDNEGGAIGPNLTGVGSRFSRIHLIESILDPSRTIAPSYETLAVSLESGRVVTGVKIAEDETTLSLGDETGKRHDIPRKEIDERTVQRNSTMPIGLEKRFSDREFLDLLTFLQAQKKAGLP